MPNSTYFYVAMLLFALAVAAGFVPVDIVIVVGGLGLTVALASLARG